jgi:hypothetical protein
MLQSPSQEALTDPIVPILGVLLFLHNEDLCPSSERIYLSEGSSITRKHSFLAPLCPRHLDTRLHNSNYPVEETLFSFHHPLLNILTPDYPISISPYQKHPEFALSSTMERKIENRKLSVLSMSIPQLWPHYLQADPRFL